MKDKYPEDQLLTIAQECAEFEHIIAAMGYGYSLLNVSPHNYKRRCPDCLHWLGGSCAIFLSEISPGGNISK